MTRLGIAVVGLGAFGVRYLAAFNAQAGVDVRWGCDLDESSFAAARAAGAARCTTRLADVLADEDVNAVVVVTPEAAHRAVSVAASTAGKHVIVEKPLATSDEDAQAMIAAAGAAQRHLLPAFLLRFDTRYAQLAQRLPEIAPVRNVYAYRNFDRGLFSLYGRTHSFIENAIHDIDLIRWYVQDDVVDVHAYCRSTTSGPNPDINWGVLEFAGGALAVLQTSWLYPAQTAAELQWNAGIQLMGEHGVLECRNDADGLQTNTDAHGLAVLDQSAWSTIHGEPRGAFGAMIRHFTACLRGDLEPRGATATDARTATQIAQRLIAASTA
jgi:predicted dehydrogenase